MKQPSPFRSLLSQQEHEHHRSRLSRVRSVLDTSRTLTPRGSRPPSFFQETRKLEIKRANARLVERMVAIKRTLGEYNPQLYLPPTPHAGRLSSAAMRRKSAKHRISSENSVIPASSPENRRTAHFRQNSLPKGLF